MVTQVCDMPHLENVKPKRISKLGPFLLLKTLGVGEFGKVKMGKHAETDQKVAVKLVKKENIDSSVQLEKIRMEIEILKTLNHPFIVKLLTVNETSSCIGIVLEYAEGGELFEYIYKQKYLQEQEACRLFSQLISCVHYMHQKNIVHRDLKLENILLDSRGDLIVTDFGFANHFSPETGDMMSTSCGSPCYAAPELVMTGHFYSGRATDIWSSGVILYAMLCGYLPFDDDTKNPNDNIGRLYRYIMINSPKYPARLSLEARDLIGGMLVPDPAGRWTIEVVMAHPWLHPYAHLFEKSTDELEQEAIVVKQSLLMDNTLDLECDLSTSTDSSSPSSLVYETSQPVQKEEIMSLPAVLHEKAPEPSSQDRNTLEKTTDGKGSKEVEKKKSGVNTQSNSLRAKFFSSVRQPKKGRPERRSMIQPEPTKSAGLISWIKNKTHQKSEKDPE